MTKKERTIKACRQLAAKYRKPKGEAFFDDEFCPLCKMNNGGFLDRICRECPLADEEGDPGCDEFSSYQNAYGNGYPPYHQEAFEARAAFFDKIIPILEKIPPSRFTKKGWKYFKELDRSW